MTWIYFIFDIERKLSFKIQIINLGKLLNEISAFLWLCICSLTSAQYGGYGGPIMPTNNRLGSGAYPYSNFKNKSFTFNREPSKSHQIAFQALMEAAVPTVEAILAQLAQLMASLAMPI